MPLYHDVFVAKTGNGPGACARDSEKAEQTLSVSCPQLYAAPALSTCVLWWERHAAPARNAHYATSPPPSPRVSGQLSSHRASPASAWQACGHATPPPSS